ncbi:MAG: TlpA disulfide reductase family protein [Myxococcota bacterium]|nr:TlpA disulfide reductase family protein [Myxococcota bacterium]
MTCRHTTAAARRATLFSMLAIAFVALAVPAAAVEEGQKAPSFSAPPLEGDGPISLDRYKGKVVYLDFWASWCGPCLVSLPLLDELRREFPPDRFQVVAVNVDRDVARARRFLKKRPVGYPSATDPEGRIPEKFGIETMPTSFLIDAKGVVRHVHAGFRKGDIDDIRKRIKALMAKAGR